MDSFDCCSVLLEYAMFEFLRRVFVKGGVESWRVNLIEKPLESLQVRKGLFILLPFGV